MSSREEPQLFDLPLDPEPPRERKRKGRAGRRKGSRPEPEQVELPFGAGEEAVEGEEDQPDLYSEEDEEYGDDFEENWEEEEVEESLLLERVFAGLADLGVHLAVLSVVVAGIGSFGIVPGWHHFPALVLFMLPFSFVYSVVPLAFWGQTPGMAWRELRCFGEGETPLTAGQAILRWIGGLVTLLLAGLPLLLLLGERSLADRMSASQTDFSDGTFLRG